MTAYHGGKQRIGLEIAENIHLLSTILEDHSNFKIKGYCEPFCGMLGVYKHIPELFDDHKPKLNSSTGKKVYKREKETNQMLSTWESIAKAAESEGISAAKMSRCVKNKIVINDYFYSTE